MFSSVPNGHSTILCTFYAKVLSAYCVTTQHTMTSQPEHRIFFGETELVYVTTHGPKGKRFFRGTLYYISIVIFIGLSFFD